MEKRVGSGGPSSHWRIGFLSYVWFKTRIPLKKVYTQMVDEYILDLQQRYVAFTRGAMPALMYSPDDVKKTLVRHWLKLSDASAKSEVAYEDFKYGMDKRTLPMIQLALVAYDDFLPMSSWDFVFLLHWDILTTENANRLIESDDMYDDVGILWLSNDGIILTIKNPKRGYYEEKTPLHMIIYSVTPRLIGRRKITSFQEIVQTLGSHNVTQMLTVDGKKVTPIFLREGFIGESIEQQQQQGEEEEKTSSFTLL